MRVSSTARPHEAWWAPSRVVAGGTRGEHARWPIGVADEAPRFASEHLIGPVQLHGELIGSQADVVAAQEAMREPFASLGTAHLGRAGRATTVSE